MTSMLRHDDAWVREHAHDWVERGLLSGEQADAIVELECGAAGPRVDERDEGTELPLAAEATAYVGSVLALLAGLFVMGQSWDEIPVAARVAVGVAVALLGLAGGRLVAALSGAGAQRLAGFLRAVGTAGAGFAVGVVTFEADLADWLSTLLIGAVIVAVSAPLWRNLDRPLQMLTTVAGVATMAASPVIVIEPPPWVVGLVAWIAGLAFGLAGMGGRVRPAVYVACVGAVGMLAGSTSTYDLFAQGGVFPVVATAALIVVAGLASHMVPVLVIGILALLQSTVQMLAAFVQGPIALLILLVIGVSMVVVVLRRVQSSA